MKVTSLTDECLSLEVETTLRDTNERELLGSHEDSNTNDMGENTSSCEEASADLAQDLQRTKLDCVSTELNKSMSKTYENERSDNQRRESGSLDPEMVDSEEASGEKGDNFVPIDVISNAVRTRRSILRRTSSTSTDESLGDENDFNGTPESPSRKNVRFNLNPNVRVFSNKKDKKKRKLEARLKAEARKHSMESEGSGCEQSNGTSPVDDGTPWNGIGDESRGLGVDLETVVVGKGEGTDQADSKINGASDQSDSVCVLESANKPFGLTNDLIFELDD